MRIIDKYTTAEHWRAARQRAARYMGVPLGERLTAFMETADRMLRGGMPLEEAASILATFHDLSRFEEGGAAEEFWEGIFSTARKLTQRRNRLGRLRSLWGVTPIASISYGARADRQLGLASDSLVFNTYYITSNFDVNLSRLEAFIIKDHYGLSYTFRRYVLAWSLLNYDIFHLYNDRGLLEPAGGYGSDRFGINLTEMQAYAKAGKFLFTYAYGADYRMRQKTLASAPLNFCMECPEPGKFCLCDDVGGIAMLVTIRAHATRMVGFGLSLELLPDARFMNYLVADMDELKPTHVDAPAQNLPEPAPQPHPEALRSAAQEPRRMMGQAGATLRGSQGLAPQGEGGYVEADSYPTMPLRVGHFPNHGFFKGSRFLLAAIEELQAEGNAIELVQFSGLPRTEILAAMLTVDVVVDQLISGSFGMTAVEAMALGQPVIGHLRKDVQISARADCPIIEATPDSIKAVLAGLVADRSPLDGKGAQGQRFVYRNHSIDSLTGELARLYREAINPSALTQFRLSLGEGRARKAIAARCDGISKGSARPMRKILDRASRLARKLFVEKRLLSPRGWLGILRRNGPRLFTHAKRIVATAMNASTRFFVYEMVVPLSRWLTTRRLKKGRARTLWGCTPILTLPLKVRADKTLGFKSHSLVFATYYISKQFDINLQKLTNGTYKYLPYVGFVFDKLMLSWFMLRYDVFHFFYDRGILRPTQRFGVNLEELELLRAAGKRVYLYAYGADVRQRQKTLALGKWNFCTECPDPMKFCVCDDTIGNRTMAEMCARVTQAIALGDMLAYVPDVRNMHYWPIDLDMIPLAASPRVTGPLKIAHAPNHMHFKGSHYLEATIEKLRGAGHAIDYVKVQGVPNSEVIRLFGEADLIADQFIGGAYGYTALEAMARGKPVMTYVRSPDLVEAVAECPLINVTPDTLEETLLWLLNNRETLPAIGAQGRYYVEAWHSIDAVAERLGHLYEDTADFPPATMNPILAQRRQQETRRQKLVPAQGWAHPFLIGSDTRQGLAA